MIFNVGRVLVLNDPRGGGGGGSTSVECLFSITPAEKEDEIQRRSSARSQYPPRRRRKRFNVGRVLVLNNPRGRGGGGSTPVECLFSITPAEEEEEVQRRWSRSQ